MLKITKNFIQVNNFESTEIALEQENTNEKYRPRSGIVLPPSADEQQVILRKKFAVIFATNYKNTAQLEVRCGISESVMRKYLKGTRRITRDAVAKICVGTPLPIEQSEELFTLQGHSLEPTKQLFDYIVVNAIQDGDDIGIFFDTCEEYGIKIS